MERLLETIQARKLDRLAAGYAVGAWLLVQAASIALPAFDAPGWLLKALILLSVLGFPLVITVGWMGAPHLAGASAGGARRPLAQLAAVAVLATVLVLIGAEVVYRVVRQDANTAAASVSMPAQVEPPAATSVAVLPFVNMSGDRSSDYLSDGISEELLNNLANVPDLRVAARTSSFAFKGKNQDVKTIARLLAVRSVLEGSVREKAQHLRIHAELIDARNGYALWSASYDRDMTDALTVQDDIARAIVAALTHKLLPKGSARPNRPQSIDPQAYRQYLEAQYELGPRTQAGSEKALALFQQVVVKQPDFADAFAGLGHAYLNVADYHTERKDLIPAADDALARALALDPNNLAALSSHLDLALHRMQWKTATADAHRMNTINPHSQLVLHEMFRYYQALGFPEEALAAAKGAAQLNRMSIVDGLNLAVAYNHVNRFVEGAKAAEDARALYPTQPFVLAMLCTGYAHSNRLEQARAIQAQLTQMRETNAAAGCAFDIALGAGRRNEALSVITKLAAQFPSGDLGATDIADSYASAGDYASAIKWANRAYDLREFVLFTLLGDKAISRDFFETPGWKALWAKPLAREWQAAHDAVAADLSKRPTD
jgi:TolB-like protein